MRLLSIAASVCLLAVGSTAEAADVAAPSPEGTAFQTPPPDPSRKADAVLVFAGALSTRNMGSSANFDMHWPIGPNYDNYIVGAAYNHDFYSLYGFAIGGEVGLADRFGYFLQCCEPVIKSSSMINSPEIWFGSRFSFDGLTLFNTFRIGGGMTFGFSFTGDSIGVERGREIVKNGSARVLGYLGPEIFFALADHPEWEIVYRLHHRSGANGTFGHMGEGYNANVLGVRYRF
jgi:hypothetical protein